MYSSEDEAGTMVTNGDIYGDRMNTGSRQPYFTRGSAGNAMARNLNNNHIGTPMPPLTEHQNRLVGTSQTQDEDVNAAAVIEDQHIGCPDSSTFLFTDTTSSDSRNARVVNLVKVYGEGLSFPKNETTEKSIKKIFRTVVLPDLKFVQTAKKFASFDQPDFSDPASIGNLVFNKIPTLAKCTDRVKAKTWITYRSTMKDMLSMHKSKVTVQMKTKMVAGKFKIFHSCEDAMTIILTLLLSYSIEGQSRSR